MSTDLVLQFSAAPQPSPAALVLFTSPELTLGKSSAPLLKKNSELLRKAAGLVPHEGGSRFAVASEDEGRVVSRSGLGGHNGAVIFKRYAGD